MAWHLWHPFLFQAWKKQGASTFEQKKHDVTVFSFLQVILPSQSSVGSGGPRAQDGSLGNRSLTIHKASRIEPNFLLCDPKWSKFVGGTAMWLTLFDVYFLNIYIYIHMVFFCLMWWHFRWADFLVWLALGFEVHFQATLLEMDLLHPFPSPFYQDMEADWEAISSWLCLCLFPGISSQALKAFLSPPSSFTSCRRCHQISTAPLHALKTVGGWIQWYRLVLENEKDVLVMFFAPWCGCLTSIKRWEGNW